MTEDIYRQLQLRLDSYSMGFPAAKSGIEIKILRYLFSEENARMFLALTHSLAPASSIASSLNRPEADVAAQLEEMTEKGLVFRVKKVDNARYAAIPFVHGLFEFQVKDIKPELAKMIQDYFDEAFDKTMLENAEYFLRTIPVNQSIDVTRQVATYDDAIEILKTKSRIVVTDCICRKSKTVLDECTGCEQCLERCQMEAISMNDDELAQVNPDRCIGCGLCVTTCPVEAITLSPKPDASLRLPPTNTSEQMMLMAQKRGIL
jgi:electron transport complex protein RnfB